MFFLGGGGNTAGHKSHQPWESPKFDGCQEQVILLQQTLGEESEMLGNGWFQNSSYIHMFLCAN